MPKFGKATILGLLVGALGCVLALTDLGLALEEEFGLHWLFTFRGPVPAPSDVVVITIDKTSAAALGQADKIRNWNRALHAELIDKLAALGVSVIVFDVFFEKARPAEDAVLADAMARSRRVVLFQWINQDKLGSIVINTLLDPASELADAAQGLAPFPVPKVAIRTHQFWAFCPSAGGAPALPVVALQLHALRLIGYQTYARLLHQAGVKHLPPAVSQAQDLRALMDELRVQLRKNPTQVARFQQTVKDEPLPQESSRVLTALATIYGNSQSYYQNYYGPPGTITTIPYRDFWTDAGQTHDLAGKIVFVGGVELRNAARGDDFVTVFRGRDNSDISGVEMAATAFTNLLNEHTLRLPGVFANLGIVLIFGALAGLLTALLSGIHAVVASVVLGALYFALAQFLFARYSLWMPLFMPLALQLPLAVPLGLLAQYLSTRREGEHIRRAIRYYIPEQVAQRHEAGSGLPAPELIYGVCLASDVTGYTTLSENLTPQALMALNNEYFGLLGEQVKAQKGEILGIVGDGMTCAWSARQPDRELRLRACLASIGILEAMKDFNQRHPRHAFHTRVGLHAGWVTIGHVGGGGRFMYGFVGDMVNTASRIERLNKYLGTRLLAAEAVVADLGELLLRPVGRFLLKGKSDALPIVEIIGLQAYASAAQRALCEQFAAALAAFEAAQWSQAVALFERILTDYPLDGPAQFYLRRCRQYSTTQTLPAEGSVIRLETK